MSRGTPLPVSGLSRISCVYPRRAGSCRLRSGLTGRGTASSRLEMDGIRRRTFSSRRRTGKPVGKGGRKFQPAVFSLECFLLAETVSTKSTCPAPYFDLNFTGLVKREEPPLCEYKHNQQLVSWHREKGHYVFSFEHPAKKGKWWSSIGAGDSMQVRGIPT